MKKNIPKQHAGHFKGAIVPAILFFIGSFQLFAQNDRMISRTVKLGTEILPGVSVCYKDNEGTVTDAQGNYSVKSRDRSDGFFQKSFLIFYI